MAAARPDAFGPILHENWLLKRELAAGVSTADLDEWYDLDRKAGVSGGKILGAGSGGFLMFRAPTERIPDIQKALVFLRPVPFRLEQNGSQITFYKPTNLDY